MAGTEFSGYISSILLGLEKNNGTGDSTIMSTSVRINEMNFWTTQFLYRFGVPHLEFLISGGL